jgi:hypothetical protein
MNQRALIACVLPIASLFGCSDDLASESLEQTSSNSDALISCNDGALLVRASEQNDWEHVVTVYDQNVVDWFIAQASATVEGTSSSGEIRRVDAELPWQMRVETRDDGTRTLELRELRAHADGTRFTTSGPPGSSLTWEGAGMRLAIGNAFMPSSKEVVYYSVGEWLFESCEEPAGSADDGTGVEETIDSYCGDPIFTGETNPDTGAPLIGGFEVWSSTHDKVAQVIEKYGSHKVEFVYEDAPHSSRIAADVDAILRYGHTSICFDATPAALSPWGTPTEVLPVSILQPPRQ